MSWSVLRAARFPSRRLDKQPGPTVAQTDLMSHSAFVIDIQISDKVPKIMQDAVKLFLDGRAFAVAGASTDPAKFGNQVYRALVKSGRPTFPLNPRATEIEGDQAYSSLAELPEIPDCLSIITPPAITQQVVGEAIAAGVKHLWMQPGAQHPEASAAARNAGLTVVDDGTCLLIVLDDER